jgi:NADPH:quinone reductase-like Zn-dependent oxidoreductase
VRVDIPTIDARYQEVQAAATQVGQAFTTLAGKLQTAAAAGDANAREWLLDLKDLAVQVRDEQGQAGNLCQAMHDFIVNTLQEHEAQQAAQQQAPQPSGFGRFGGGYGGGMLGRFQGSGFGHAMAMGAAWGIGDDLIRSIL